MYKVREVKPRSFMVFIHVIVWLYPNADYNNKAIFSFPCPMYLCQIAEL